MDQKSYNVVGVMSGTSLDGIDCAYAKISLTQKKPLDKYPSFDANLITAKTFPYPNEWKEILSSAHKLTSEELKSLNLQYTEYLAKIIKGFTADHKLTEIDLVCSHGHTVLHNPKEGYTLQIGNLSQLAQHINHKVVCDFRVQDVALGGQGAPLVPIGDALLYPAYDYCLNLGGFANVSKQEKGIRIAYDICPVNVVLNRYAQKLDKEYDEDGAFAKAGNIHTELLNALNALPFYKNAPPKSLGIEWVHEHIFPLIDQFAISPKDVLATFTEHIAVQLLSQFTKDSVILITGGGAYNSFLMERLRFRESVKIIIPDDSLVEFKEALIFGLLGVLRIEELPNCLSSVTGAERDHSSGVVFIP